MTPWPHQLQAIDDIDAAVRGGERRICLSSPTGAGKTWIMQELARRALERGEKVVLYSNRRALIDQTSEAMMEAGIYHGVRAAGYQDEREHPFQVSSIQTEHARVMRAGIWQLHEADWVLVDEGHLQTGEAAQEICNAHYEAGAVIVFFTATPIGMASVCDTLIQAGSMSECRACGALVEARHFGPDEPDLAALRHAQRKIFAGMTEGEDLTERQARAAMMTPGIFGRVWDNFERLNPEHRPTILFAPGVQESIWFCDKFNERGVTAAHIDGENVYVRGELHPTERSARADLLAQSRQGRIVVLCNRFVLREGIDCPWLSHGILATIFGSVQSYMQAGGRLLRSFPGVQCVTVQDHGGNWWRHGSLNEDRDWCLDYSAERVYDERAERLRQKTQDEPFLCPRCKRVWGRGRICNPAKGGCGFELHGVKRSRPVVSLEGTLKEMTGDIFRPRRRYAAPNGPAIWERMYWRSKTKKGARSFRAAFALFAMENNWGWPDPSWPFMPIDEGDRWAKVSEVPMDRLIQKGHHA